MEGSSAKHIPAAVSGATKPGWNLSANRSHDPRLPLVSIVTACLNRRKFLEQAIDSLRAQDYPNIEHIVVDGGSTDGTAELLSRNQDLISWVSEPDRGQSDALNKALGMASGEIIGWLNSDDLYLPGAVSRAVDILMSDPKLDLFYGTTQFVDAEGKQIDFQRTKPLSVTRLVWYDPFCFSPQSMFFRRRVVDQVGGFDVALRFALDYDWMIRVGKQCRVRQVQDTLGVMRRHEDATQGSAYRDAYRQEIRRVSRRYGGRLFAPLYLNPPIPASVIRWIRPLKRRLVDTGVLPRWA